MFSVFKSKLPVIGKHGNTVVLTTGKMTVDESIHSFIPLYPTKGREVKGLQPLQTPV